MSLILYHDEEQREIAEQSRAEEVIKRAPEVIRTEISPKTNFFPAEEYVHKFREIVAIKLKLYFSLQLPSKISPARSSRFV